MGGEPSVDQRRATYWRRTLKLTFGLLAIWFIVTFAIAFFARELAFRVFGWPFSFYMAAQGAPIVYVLIVWFYARRMRELDRSYDGAEDA